MLGLLAAMALQCCASNCPSPLTVVVSILPCCARVGQKATVNLVCVLHTSLLVRAHDLGKRSIVSKNFRSSLALLWCYPSPLYCLAANHCHLNSVANTFCTGRRSFDEIPEVRACTTPDSCEIVDPIEFAMHGETSKVTGERFFDKAKEMLGLNKA